MARMRNPIRVPRRGTIASSVLAAILAGGLAACAGPAPSPSVAPPTTPATAPPEASVAVVPTPIPSASPDLTPVPGSSDEPIPPPDGGTTVIDWGTILDAVPEDFPVYAGASPTDSVDGPSSGAWFAEGVGVDEVATWYRDRLEAMGFTTQDLSSPLEDGSRVLDTVSDVPECRVQTTFRPVDGSTMITVLYGAGCAGGEG